MANYLYNGVELPEPPSGFSGHMLLVNDAETAQYVLCYGTFYAYPFDPKPIVFPSASLPTCYGFREATGQWVEIPIIPDGGDAPWTLACSPNEYVWTNSNIYWLDEYAKAPTSEVAYEGREAVAVIPDDPDEPVVPDEPVLDPYSTSLLMGYRVGQMIRGMRVKREPETFLYAHMARDGETATHTIDGVGYVGAVLPDINTVWTDELKKQYPYAAICRTCFSSVYYYYLYIAAAPFYVTKEYYTLMNITEWYISGLLNCKVWRIVNYEQPPNVWEMYKEEFPYDRQAITSTIPDSEDDPIVWCSHAIYDSTNNQLWIAASDPIPVYDKE